MAGFALVVFAFVIKLRIEERWMLEAFKEEYAQYQATVPALIPFLF